MRYRKISQEVFYWSHDVNTTQLCAGIFFMFAYSTSESENVGLTGLVSDNPFVFNLSKTFLVLAIIKLPFRVVLSALCIVSASVGGHSTLMITRITMTALVDREICTSGKWWSQHTNLLALKSTLVMIILSWLALCGGKVPLKAACVDVCSLSAFSPVTSSHPEWDH